MNSSPSAPAQSLRKRSSRGFTLVEAMVACCVFCMCTLGVYGMLIQSYKMAALSRCRDNARAVIRTYADQFERLQTTNLVSGSPATRWLFYPFGATGAGLAWGALSDSDCQTNAIASGAVPYLTVNLGTSTNPVPAQITQDVSYVDDSTGATSIQHIKAAGYMLRSTYTISFTINSAKYSEALTLVRAVP